MPHYDYVCKECNTSVELFKKISERDDTATEVCANCGKADVLNRSVGAPLISYSVTVPGSYGRSIPSGFKEVLNRVHQRAPGSRLNETSSHM